MGCFGWGAKKFILKQFMCFFRPPTYFFCPNKRKAMPPKAWIALSLLNLEGPRFAGSHLDVSRESFRQKSGEIQKGTGGRGRDRKCHKLSQIVVTFYDEFYDDL